MSSASRLQSHPLGQLSKIESHRRKVASGGPLQDVASFALEGTVFPGGAAFVTPRHLLTQLPGRNHCYIPFHRYVNLFSLVVGSRFSV